MAKYQPGDIVTWGQQWTWFRIDGTTGSMYLMGYHSNGPAHSQPGEVQNNPEFPTYSTVIRTFDKDDSVVLYPSTLSHSVSVEDPNDDIVEEPFTDSVVQGALRLAALCWLEENDEHGRIKKAIANDARVDTDLVDGQTALDYITTHSGLYYLFSAWVHQM